MQSGLFRCFMINSRFFARRLALIFRMGHTYTDTAPQDSLDFLVSFQPANMIQSPVIDEKSGNTGE
jgi:hypothetical protein